MNDLNDLSPHLLDIFIALGKGCQQKAYNRLTETRREGEINKVALSLRVMNCLEDNMERILSDIMQLKSSETNEFTEYFIHAIAAELATEVMVGYCEAESK